MGLGSAVIILFVAAVVLFVLEIFIPSGGLLAVLSASCLAGAIVCSFMIDPGLGLLAVIVALIGVPCAIALAIKVFPNTPVGKLMILSDSQTTTVKRDEGASDERASELVGRRGVAITGLRPVGTCRVEGQRLECLSEVGTIEAGTPVEVTRVQETQIRVRAVEDFA